MHSKTLCTCKCGHLHCFSSSWTHEPVSLEPEVSACTWWKISGAFQGSKKIICTSKVSNFLSEVILYGFQVTCCQYDSHRPIRWLRQVKCLKLNQLLSFFPNASPSNISWTVSIVLFIEPHSVTYLNNKYFSDLKNVPQIFVQRKTTTKTDMHLRQQPIPGHAHSATVTHHVTVGLR